ncbi:cation transporting ATPase C-terminal domain-containing protein [Microvirga makkahensis]|uniref:Cation-transporting P-type ATPase C-terminal domain-containing protein n=1 Tax=Microvirga makkahensis TaxID=1128670 RepID=A0A7X3MT22_9HYPH|nr:cation transporting ATPase C-terminal domain-containing protein [Microvirga makkahensis]MXQ12475.1 hypothetical protein [Microvirga makkahensis]
MLADDNFATVVAAVEEGRSVLSNVGKLLRYLLTSSIGEVMTKFFDVLMADVIGMGPDGSGSVVLPLLATHIPWIDRVTDGAPAVALRGNPVDDAIMRVPPRPRGRWSGRHERTGVGQARNKAQGRGPARGGISRDSGPGADLPSRRGAVPATASRKEACPAGVV